MKKILVFIILSMLLSFGAEHGKFGIAAEMSPTSFMPNPSQYYWFWDAQFETLNNIQLRYCINPKLGVDVGVGYSSMSDIEADSTTKTDAEPGNSSYGLYVGMVYTLKEYEKANFNIFLGYHRVAIGKYGYASVYDTSTGSENYVSQVSYTYKKIQQVIVLGCEPSLFFNKHFSLYTKYGLSINNTGSSRTTDPDHKLYDEEEEPKLISRKDERQMISLGLQALIGMRFYF